MNAEVLEPAQYDAWNAFVNESPQGDVFCYSWWLDAITKSNFKILVIKHDRRIVAGMPLTYDSFGKINLPPLTRTLGILFSNTGNSSDHRKLSDERRCFKTLIENIRKEDFVQTCTHHNFSDWLPYRWSGLSQTTRYTYLLEFKQRTINDLWSNLDSLRKRTITRAEKNGINVSVSDDFELVYKFARLTYHRQGLKFRLPYSDLRQLDDALRQRGNRVIFAAKANCNIHAVLYAVTFGTNSAYYLLSGSDPERRSEGGHTLVMWEALKYFQGKVNYFNFGGSDVYNIESHIRGFGGVLTPYFHIFNEDNLSDYAGLRYHLRKISFHTVASLRVLKNRILQDNQILKNAFQERKD